MDEEKDKTASQVTDEEESREELDSTRTGEQSENDTQSDEVDKEVSEEVDDSDKTEEETETESEPEKKPSRRESLRIQQLIDKLREKEKPAAPEKTDQGLDYRKHLEADDEVIKQLESDRRKYGESQYNQGLEQAKSIQFHTRLELDAPRVHSKYPQFNPESEEFNPVAANAINEWYLATVGFDSDKGTVANAKVRYAEFVEGIMELADEMAGQKVATTTKNIAKQVASTGLRPDGSSAKRLNLNQAPETMSDEELDTIIKASIPPRKR